MLRTPNPLWLLSFALYTLAAPSPSHGAGALGRLTKAVKGSSVGRAAQRAGRALQRSEQQLSAHLTLLVDKTEKQLAPAQAAKLHRLRLANPMTVAGFVGTKIKADWNPLWMWAPASFAISTGMHYWLAEEAGLGFWPSALIRVPVGLAIDLTVIGGYNHYRRKERNPAQTLRTTLRQLSDEYLVHADERRARNRQALGGAREPPSLRAPLLRSLHGRLGARSENQPEDGSKSH